MAKHLFTLGNKLGGRKPLPAEIKAIRNLSYEEAIKTICHIRELNRSEAKNIDLNDITLAEFAILKAYTSLDYKAIKEYEDRIWGKAKEQIELSGDKDNPLNFKIEILPVKPKE